MFTENFHKLSAYKKNHKLVGLWNIFDLFLENIHKIVCLKKKIS